MKRMSAAILATVISFFVCLAGIAFVAWLRHGNVNANDPELIQIGSLVALGVVLSAWIRAYRNPDGFFDFFLKIPSYFSLSKLNTQSKRFMYLIFLTGIFVCIITFAVYIANDSSKFLRSTEEFFTYAIFNGHRYKIYRFSFFIGILLMLFGVVGSFWFDKLFGRLLNWLRNGN